MRIVVQRVTSASVTVGSEQVSRIGNGMLILVGICAEDTIDDIEYLTSKTVNLRIFDDEKGVMNRSILESGGDIIAVSQFTLMASTKKGNRPSYIRAAHPEISKPLYEKFCDILSTKLGKKVGEGIFGADMKVDIANDGPVTIIIDSKSKDY